jgi:capsular polysaccharide biosynthesis protein
MEQKSGESLFDSTQLVLFIWQKRKIILIATAISLVASVVFSSPFFIKPKFKSSVILFPTTNSSISRSLLSEMTFEKENILQFGEEEQVEQMMQILHSDEVRDRVIKKFNLMDHYRVNPNGSYPRTELNRKIDENISFNRTEYLSVRIDVLDENPQMAADIANTIGDLLDSVKTRMQHDRAKKALAIVEKEYFDFLRYMNAREDTLNKLRMLGVLNYDAQVERLSEAYGKAVMAGSSSATKIIEEKMNILVKYGGIFTAIIQDMEHDRLALSRLKTKYEEAKVDATQELPNKFVVNMATPAEKKSYPVRWLIVLISTLGTFLLSIITVLLLENIQRIRLTKPFESPRQ